MDIDVGAVKILVIFSTNRHGHMYAISRYTLFIKLTRHAFIPDQNGTNALHSASAGGHLSVVTLLLDAKADVNHVDQVRHVFFR